MESIVWNEENKLLGTCSVDGWIKVSSAIKILALSFNYLRIQVWSIENDEPIKHLKVDVECVSLTWCPNRKITENKIIIDTKKPLIVW